MEHAEEGGERTWREAALTGYGNGRWGTSIKAHKRQLAISFVVDAMGYGARDSLQARPQRQALVAWSKAMGRRLRFMIDNAETQWKIMVTLTYPGQWPRNGKTAKGHLRALWERMRRLDWFKTGIAVWWMEFQARGAPHFHFVANAWIPKVWLAGAWAAITGGDARACSRVEGLKKPEAAGSYAAKYAAKQEQKEVPADFQDVGRFWGRVGGGTAAEVVPCLTAVLPRVGVGQAKSAVERLIPGARVYETPVGYTVYGSELEIRRIYKWLTAAKSSATTTKSAGLTRQKTQDA